MRSKLIIRAIIFAAATTLLSLFASSVFAIASCGACKPGTAPNTSVHSGVNASGMACTNCHSAPAPTPTPAPTPIPTPKPTPAPTPMPGPGSGGVTVHPTSDGCGACVVGTAPGGVSAHANVNSTLTPCVICHRARPTVPGSTGGGTTGSRSDDGPARGTMPNPSGSNGKRGHRD